MRSLCAKLKIVMKVPRVIYEHFLWPDRDTLHYIGHTVVL